MMDRSLFRPKPPLDAQAKLPGPASKPMSDTRFLCGLQKGPSDSLKVASPNSQQELAEQASLRVDKNNTTRSLQFRDSQLFGSPQFGLDSGRQAGSSREVKRDVRASASMGDAGETAPQEQFFKAVFEKALREQGITVSEDQGEQLVSIKFDSSVSDMPPEWQKPFLIARGQTCERVRIGGYNLQSSVSITDDHKIKVLNGLDLYTAINDSLLSDKLEEVSEEKFLKPEEAKC